MEATIQEKKIRSFIANLTPTKVRLRSELIDHANKVLEETDFPTSRTEAWKYTRVIRIANTAFRQTMPGTLHLDQRFEVVKNAVQLVFENGRFLENLSTRDLPAGLTVRSIEDCSAEELTSIGSLLPLDGNVFNAINTAYASGGAMIALADKTVLERPVQIIHILSGNEQIANLRHYLRMGKFSQAEFVTAYFSANASNSFQNGVLECTIEEGAHLSIQKIQAEQEGNFQIITEQVDQAKDSVFTINTLTLNGSFVRNNLNIEVNGTNCETHLNGAYILKENQHVDNHTCVDHKVAHCQSNELYKGVIDDKATAVFNGKVFVRQDAQKINAFQSNGNVLLSDQATVNSKPELEIYADDVKCSHGSTTGQLDDEAIFYLRARGISERSARHLMVAAFIGDVLEKVDNEDVINFTHDLLKERFGWEL